MGFQPEQGGPLVPDRRLRRDEERYQAMSGNAENSGRRFFHEALRKKLMNVYTEVLAKETSFRHATRN
jgi:hypothetical protein